MMKHYRLVAVVGALALLTVCIAAGLDAASAAVPVSAFPDGMIYASAVAPSLASVSEQLDKINAAITKEREANDERLKEIEKQGSAYPETVAKIKNIEGDIAKLRSGLDESLKSMARLSVGGAGGD